jgi:hypothetical protein
MVGNGGRTTRRRNPYFGNQAKGSVVKLHPEGRRNPHEPSMTPEQEDGLLWAAFQPRRKPTSTES